MRPVVAILIIILTSATLPLYESGFALYSFISSRVTSSSVNVLLFVPNFNEKAILFLSAGLLHTLPFFKAAEMRYL